MGSHPGTLSPPPGVQRSCCPSHCCGPATAVNLFSRRCCLTLHSFIEASSLKVYNVNKTHCGLSCVRLSGPPAPWRDKPQEDIKSKVKLYFTVIFHLYTKNYSTCSGSTWAGQPSFHYKFHIHSQQSKGSKMKVINGPRLSPLPLLKIIYMLELCRFLPPALASPLRTDRGVLARAKRPRVPHAAFARDGPSAPTPARSPLAEPMGRDPTGGPSKPARGFSTACAAAGAQ